MSDPRVRDRRPWIIATLAVTALLAIIVAVWLVSGQRARPADPVAEGSREQLLAADRWAAVIEAEVSLATVRADLATESGGEGLDRRLDHVAGQLQAALEGDAAADAAWTDLEPTLEQLEQQLRLDDPAAAETLASADDALRSVGP